jgi:hypothetical protein
MSTIINGQLAELANSLLAKARRENVKGATYARIYAHIVEKTAWGRSFSSLEKLHRTALHRL